MPLELGWEQICGRLVLAMVAGMVLGWNRRKHAHAAGMRTTLLVCLAAAVAMVQVNLLIGQRGKMPDSFVQLDMMRLPLGILTGVGFIGAGAILRRGGAVQGVTTAATIWFSTVLGLCFGSGLIWLGLGALGCGWFALVILKWLEERLPQDRRGTLVFSFDRSAMDEAQLREHILKQGFRIYGWKIHFEGDEMKGRCNVKWRGLEHDRPTPAIVGVLAQMPGTRRIAWRC